MSQRLTSNVGLFPRLTAKATATLPQTAQSALFNVVGGKVKIHDIIGEVTTIIENTANNAKIVHNPTVGSDTDLCAAGNIQAMAVGTVCWITGDVSDGIQADANGMVDSTPTAFTRELILSAGTIDLNCSASTTGSIKWVVRWSPIDIGATVTSA